MNFFRKIRSFLLRLLIILLLIILTIIITLKYYEIIYFKPHFSYINKIYIQGKKEEHFTKKIKSIILCLDKPILKEESTFFSYVIARYFVYEFIEFDTKIEWHLHNFLWSKLLIYNFNKEKIFILYLHMIPFERGFGLANSAQYYFQKKTSQLTVEEIVMLLGIARSPMTFSLFLHPENAKKIQNILMEKLVELNCLP